MSIVKLVTIDPGIEFRMRQEAELAAQRYINPTIWGMLTDQQKEHALSPIMTAMRQVVHACSKQDVFVRSSDISDVSPEPKLAGE